MMADDPSPELPERLAKHGSVGIKDVARHAGVSVTTVSNVLNSTNRISSRTRDRVRASIRELGYVRNAAAHQLRAGSSTTIGLIVPDGSNPFYAAIARGAEDAAVERGATVLVGNSNRSAERESRYIDLFEEQRVFGLLIAPVADTTDRIESLFQRGITPVVVGRVAHPERCSSVSIDNVSGGYLATKHLLGTGRRRIAFVGPSGAPGVVDRLAGARMAVDEAKNATLEVIDSKDSTVAVGRQLGVQLIERDGPLPDGIFCANDLLATGMLHAFFDTHRIRVPEEVGIIGYDDIDFAASAIVPLSSIHQPADLIGRTAVDLLNQELDDPLMRHRHVLFPPELVVRESTRR
jgi:LacI family transcriptional regulator